MSKCSDTLTDVSNRVRARERGGLNKKKNKTDQDRTLTNIIHNIKMAPIVITDREIKFISSDVSMTGASIG